MNYPLKQFMTQEKVQQVRNLLNNKQDYSTILTNLLFSANNPFQEGFPFVEDTTIKKKIAKQNQKFFKHKGIMAKIYLKNDKNNLHDHHREDETSDEDDYEPGKHSKIPKVVDMYTILNDLDIIKAERDHAIAQ